MLGHDVMEFLPVPHARASCIERISLLAIEVVAAHVRPDLVHDFVGPLQPNHALHRTPGSRLR